VVAELAVTAAARAKVTIAVKKRIFREIRFVGNDMM
jgi:hypothetical protein